MDPSKQPGINVGQIILTRAHFEHREDFLSLPHTTPVPELPLNVHAQAGLGADGKSGLIRLTVSTDDTKNPLYVLDVTIVGIIVVQSGEENMNIQQYVMTSGIALLYPFMREVVANLTSRGRFGPVWLKPLNVAAAVTVQPPRPAVGKASGVTR